MKKKLKTSLFHHVACISLALMAVLLAFAACKDEPEPLSGANNITSFVINGRGGAITRTRGETELVDQDRISVTVPAATSLGSVSPVIAISSAATVSPASGEAVDLTHPFTYVVTAENGNQRFYTVTAVPEDAAVVLESIYITAFPLKVVYNADEDLNLNGLAVKGIYSDGTEKLVPQGAWDIGEYDNTKAGIQTLTVTVGGKTATFEVEFKAVTLTSLRLVRNPDKIRYAKDEDLNLAGILVEGTYSDGTEKVLETSALSHSGYDKSRVGIQTVTITVGSKTTSFSVTVIAAEPSSVSVTRNPNKTTYIKGEDLDLTGIIVTVNYSDSSRNAILYAEDLTVEDNTIGYDKNRIGPNQSVNLKIDGKVDGLFYVTIVAVAPSFVTVTRPPNKTTYLKGEDLDLTGIVVTVNYSDSSRNKILESDDLTVEDNIIGYDKTKTGSQQVYVKFDGAVTSSPLNITVNESSPLSLTIGLPKDDNGDLNIYGIPEGGIQLSVDGRNDLPKMIVISVGAVGSSNVYSQIDWYIDGTPQNSWPNSWSNNNIVTVAAAHTNPVLALNKTHTLTVEVTKDNGVVYSQTIPFKVVK